MRIAFIDRDDDESWPRPANRFAPVAERLARLGHETRLLTVSVRAPGPTIVAGAERERDVAPLIASARALAALSAPADLVVCPLRGGIAHGILMARACGELPFPLKVALWCDGAARDFILDCDFSADESLRHVVADAMERVCLDHVDHLIASSRQLLELAELPGARTPPASLVAPPQATPERQLLPREAARLAFIGPLAQRFGLFAFVETVERLWKRDSSAIGEVVFVTRAGDPASVEGARWLDLRTRRWSFPHRVIEVLSDAQAAQLVAQQDRMFVVGRRDELELPDWLAAAPNVVVAPLRGGSQGWSASLEKALLDRQADGASDPSMDGWREALAAIGAPTPVAAAPALPSISVCMLHFDRPGLLETALVSFQNEAASSDIETIIVDNASRLPESHALIARLENEGVAKIIRTDHGQPLPEAYNHAIRAARNDFAVFLDDDNMFTQHGLTRMRRACASGAFDVVVSNLAMFDDDGAEGPHLSFIGQARTAGLFFNAFGDTCMAFRRQALQALGGYLELGAPYPSPDWLLLARAHAAGLRIGVLQTPAYRYRRRPVDAAPVWQKFDRRSPRRLVFDHFGEAYDGAILARLAQTAMLEF